jgi:hypothetical protein
MVASLAAPVAAIAGIGSLTAGIGKAIGKAAEMETLEAAFQPLLGSAEAARERIAELSRFAAETPFEMPQIAAASKVLETLTKGALSTGDGLTLVGDVASATNQPFDEIATTIGRLYDGLDSGRPVGEAMARLQELGAISGETRARIEALQAEGQKGPAVWAVAAEGLGRFSGSMKIQSGTWSGLMSTLQDNIGQIFAAFGAPIIDSLKPYLASAGNLAGSMAEKAAAFGERIGAAISFIAAAFQSGQVTTILGRGIQIAFINAVNFLWAALRATIAAAGEYISQVFRLPVLYFEVLTTADFWKGMGNALMGIGYGFVALLQQGMAAALDLIEPIAAKLGFGDAVAGARDAFSQSADALNQEAANRFSSAGDQLAPVVDIVAARLQEAGLAIGDAFQDAFESTSNVIDPADAQAKLGDALSKVRDQVAKNAAEADAARAAVAASLPQPTDGAAPTDAAANTAGAARQVQADRLAQVGGFVGGSLAASRDRFAEKTEEWTRRTAEATEKLLGRVIRSAPQQTSAVF